MLGLEFWCSKVKVGILGFMARVRVKVRARARVRVRDVIHFKDLPFQTAIFSSHCF